MKRNNLFKYIPLTFVILLSSCSGNSKKATEAKKEIPKVRVETVDLIPVDQLSVFTATVEANSVNNIAPAIPGRIREIRVDVGSRVAKGQLLATMDGTNYSQQQTQLATLKRDYERYSELYNVGGISKQQLDQLKTQLDVAETALKNLGENTRLTSPISGVVTSRNYDPGDVASGLPILTVESINPVKVLINVSEAFYSKISKGMSAKIEIDALDSETFEGKVSLIHPTLNANSRTFPVEIELDNKDLRVRPGMFSRVTMNFGTNNSPLVTDVAVLKQSGSNDRYVFVEKDGRAVYTLVELGVRIGDKYEIVSGLNKGDKVITDGNSRLINGSEVEVVK